MERSRTNMDTISYDFACTTFIRSGTHFTYYLLKEYLPNCKINFYQHHVDCLKKEKNIFTTIRSPLGCVPSWIVYNKDERHNRANKILEYYIYFLQTIKETNPLLFKFETLINEPAKFLNTICKTFDVAKPVKEYVPYDLSLDLHNPTVDKSNYPVLCKEIEASPLYTSACLLFEELSLGAI